LSPGSSKEHFALREGRPSITGLNPPRMPSRQVRKLAQVPIVCLLTRSSTGSKPEVPRPEGSRTGSVAAFPDNKQLEAEISAIGRTLSSRISLSFSAAEQLPLADCRLDVSGCRSNRRCLPIAGAWLVSWSTPSFFFKSAPPVHLARKLLATHPPLRQLRCVPATYSYFLVSLPPSYP